MGIRTAVVESKVWGSAKMLGWWSFSPTYRTANSRIDEKGMKKPPAGGLCLNTGFVLPLVGVGYMLHRRRKLGTKIRLKNWTKTGAS
ncbi:MAG: hypothetical protein V4488_26520 [Pseudomonadota bacterium]